MKIIYDDSMNEKAYRLSLLGSTEKEIADFLDIALSTLSDWKRRHPQFKEALSQGKLDADSKVAEALFKRAIGYSHEDTDIRVVDGQIIKTPIEKHYPPETNAAIFWLKNRTRHSERPWLDISRNEISGPNGQAIKSANLSRLIMNQLTNDELALLEKLAIEAETTPELESDSEPNEWPSE